MDGEQVPFAVSDFDRLWVGYDDEESLVEKVGDRAMITAMKLKFDNDEKDQN